LETSTGNYSTAFSTQVSPHNKCGCCLLTEDNTVQKAGDS